MLLITGLSFLLAATSLAGDMPIASPEVQLTIGYKVVDRKVEPVLDREDFVAGATLIAWTSITGLRTGVIEHVWLRNGVEVARHHLPVGPGHRWRTWSRHRGSAGSYQVKVLGPDGRLLKETFFEVQPVIGC